MGASIGVKPWEEMAGEVGLLVARSTALPLAYMKVGCLFGGAWCWGCFGWAIWTGLASLA